MPDVYEEIARALETMRKIFGAEVFEQPGRFMAGINDIVAADAKTAKHLLRIAICDMHAYSRLEKALADNTPFTAKHLTAEMAEHYMVPPEVCERVVECIAVFVGFKPSPKSAVPTASAKPTSAKPAPAAPKPAAPAKFKPIPIKPTPIKPVAIKIPKMPVRSSPGNLAPKPPVVTAPASTPAAVPAASSVAGSGYKTGTTVRFGGRDWRVLDVQNNQALLLSEKIIDTKWYHDKNISTDWAGCSLRRYLNGDFYKSFSHDEQFRIAKTKLQNERNPWFGTAGTTGTTDRIFLLSIAEVLKYFGDSGQIRKRPQSAGHIDDQFNKARIALDSGGAPAWWWLRSPGYIPNRTAFVAANGALYVYGSVVYGAGGGVRPVMWVGG